MASPRIRSLKHTFFSDEKICEYPLAVRWTFAGLIAHADDEGRLKGDPRLVKAHVWPLDDEITAARVADHLMRLSSGSEPRIRWYRVSGRQYIEVINFKKHQYIQKPKPSELPGPDMSDTDTIRVPDEYRLDGMGWEMDGKGAERESGRTEPIPLASASTATEPLDDPTPAREPDPKPRVTLPPLAEQFVAELYGLATEKRRADVRGQLYDAIDPTKRGAFLRRGVYVRAKNPEHLGRVCLAVRMDPPQSLDTAIVSVLRKLQDAETDANGRTVTEAAAHEHRQSDAMLERYELAARSAANTWVAEHRDEHEAIKRKLAAQFPGALADNADGWQRAAYEGAHLSEVRKASGFPDFETWRAANARASPTLARVG